MMVRGGYRSELRGSSNPPCGVTAGCRIRRQLNRGIKTKDVKSAASKPCPLSDSHASRANSQNEGVSGPAVVAFLLDV